MRFGDFSCGYVIYNGCYIVNMIIRDIEISERFSGEQGIVIVRDFFQGNNTVYIVMEYLDGKTLKQLLDRGKRFSPKEIVDLMLPVMESLQVIHQVKRSTEI